MTKEFQCGLSSMCGGSQSKQVYSCGFPAWNPCDGHLVTINLDYLPQI